MNRKSPVWLIGVLLVVTGLGLAGSMVRFRLCGTCDGLAYHLTQAIKPRHPLEALPRLDCPDCGDRRNVPLFKSWMTPAVAEPVSLVLRSLCGPEEGAGLQALKQLFRADGKKPGDSQIDSSDTAFTNVRFFQVEGKTFLILLLEISGSLAGASAAAVVMVSPEGQVLDFVTVDCTDQTADLRAAFLKNLGPDGAQVIVLPPAGVISRGVETTLSCRLDQWGRPPRHETVPWKGKSDVLFRVRIRGDRLECLR